jgi:hypothetical protein
VSGPGTVTFANSAATTAGFSDPGTYLLRLTAGDGLLSSSSDVTAFSARSNVRRAIWARTSGWYYVCPEFWASKTAVAIFIKESFCDSAEAIQRDLVATIRRLVLILNMNFLPVTLLCVYNSATHSLVGNRTQYRNLLFRRTGVHA